MDKNVFVAPDLNPFRPCTQLGDLAVLHVYHSPKVGKIGFIFSFQGDQIGKT